MAISITKKILIVGTSSGIGQVLLQKLLEENAVIYSISRRQNNNEDTNVIHRQFDVINNDFVELNSFIPEELHGLVYCPGTINLKPFNRLTEEDFLHDFRINVLGAVKIIQAALSALRKGKPASVVLFSTVAAQVGLNFHASISAAKSAVEGLVKSLAAEYANSGIRFNAVAPSITQTPLAEHLLNSEQKVETSIKRHPLKQIGKPEDMANAARFLLSEESAWVTGQVLHVDGGLSSLKPL